MDNADLKNGLSGFMRVKNGAQFLEASIDSCINALDELIVVYNDCTDDTQVILEKKKAEFPEKLKIYPFNHNVLCRNLSEVDFNLAISLPEDSPRLHSTQCNYALSKVSYKYAMKIDDDQLYFEDELKRWRDVCHMGRVDINCVERLIGSFCARHISLYRVLSAKCHKPLVGMIPRWMMTLMRRPYLKYASDSLISGTGSITMSGINVFHDKCWFVTFDKYCVNPPYNGEGDHLIFKVSDKTYFKRYYDLNQRQSVIEMFYQPGRLMFADHPMWFHLHANKFHSFAKVKAIKDQFPELFVTFEDFGKMSYRQVLKKMDRKVNTLYQCILFGLVHQWSAGSDRLDYSLLNSVDNKND